MYQKISNYSDNNNNNVYNNYAYHTNECKKREDWFGFNNSLSYNNNNNNQQTEYYDPGNTYSMVVQNDHKRFKLNNNFTNFMGGYSTDTYNNNSNNNYKRPPAILLQCDTKQNTFISKKSIITSPASSTNLSLTSNESVSTEHAALCDSLQKAYQAGHLSKSRYRRLIANERERNRMHGLNVAFENLRSVLPSLGSSKQFSKYETLQMASNYIRALKNML